MVGSNPSQVPEQSVFFGRSPVWRTRVFRLGSVHRNTYLHAPSLLSDRLHFHDAPELYFAGQITGVEGYVESTACGQLIAWHLLARLRGLEPPQPPPTTAFGALRRHLRADGILSAYAPSNLNWSLFAPIDRIRREKKREKRQRMSRRAQDDLTSWWNENQEVWQFPS